MRGVLCTEYLGLISGHKLTGPALGKILWSSTAEQPQMLAGKVVIRRVAVDEEQCICGGRLKMA